MCIHKTDMCMAIKYIRNSLYCICRLVNKMCTLTWTANHTHLHMLWSLTYSVASTQLCFSFIHSLRHHRLHCYTNLPIKISSFWLLLLWLYTCIDLKLHTLKISVQSWICVAGGSPKYLPWKKYCLILLEIGFPSHMLSKIQVDSGS